MWVIIHIDKVMKMVGAEGIEPSTFWSRTKRATRLRYAPRVMKSALKLAKQQGKVKMNRTNFCKTCIALYFQKVVP